jgi:hypothetical protein
MGLAPPAKMTGSRFEGGTQRLFFPDDVFSELMFQLAGYSLTSLG